MNDTFDPLVPASEPSRVLTETPDDLDERVRVPDLSNILVVDPKTLMADLDPLATLTSGFAQMWEEILLYGPEHSGPVN